jgi:hypothetical protein
MKNFKMFLAAVAVPAMFAAVFSLSGCEKEMPEMDSPPAAWQSKLDQLPGKFKRTIELHDGANAVTLGIASESLEELNAFASTVNVKAVTEMPEADTDGPLKASPATGQNTTNHIEANAVHICMLNEIKQSGVVGFRMQVFGNESISVGKIENSGYYGGQRVFYSWEAPHYFQVSSVGNYCVLGTFYYTPNGGPTWTKLFDFGACHSSVVYQNASNSVDIRLVANGQFYYVYWY